MVLPDYLKKYLTDEDIIRLKGKEGIQSYLYRDNLFVRITQDYKSFPRGTVFYEDGIIYGYPPIMRILHLTNGIGRYFDGEFYVEEKVDGYNVRIAFIDNTLLCFTRGGFICPFTTDRVSDLVDIRFFEQYPEYVICGEVAGPGSPYNIEVIPYIKGDIQFFAFDIMDRFGKKLPLDKRYEILQPFEINQVNRWGPFSKGDIGEIKRIILELDREEREGIVIKSTSNERSAKYVTLSSCLRDLQASTHLIAELPAGFFLQRILRALFFSYEFNIPIGDEYLLESAKALYSIPAKIIHDISEGKEIKELFEIKVKNKDTIDEFLRHINRSDVRAQLISIERQGNYFKARFYRVYTEGTKELRHMLAGHGFFD